VADLKACLVRAWAVVVLKPAFASLGHAPGLLIIGENFSLKKIENV
jgi:hypothetical protein